MSENADMCCLIACKFSKAFFGATKLFMMPINIAIVLPKNTYGHFKNFYLIITVENYKLMMS